MTAAGKQLVDTFQGLPDLEKREVLADILRISRGLEYPTVSDEELMSVADDLFAEYDREEAKD
jgi:hypothetical protein